MGINKIIKSLDEYFSKGDKKKFAHCDRIDELMKQLEKKKTSLTKKIDREHSSSRKKRLKTDLKVVTLQLKKAHKKREELADKCK